MAITHSLLLFPALSPSLPERIPHPHASQGKLVFNLETQVLSLKSL